MSVLCYRCIAVLKRICTYMRAAMPIACALSNKIFALGHCQGHAHAELYTLCDALTSLFNFHIKREEEGKASEKYFCNRQTEFLSALVYIFSSSTHSKPFTSPGFSKGERKKFLLFFLQCIKSAGEHLLQLPAEKLKQVVMAEKTSDNDSATNIMSILDQMANTVPVEIPVDFPSEGQEPTSSGQIVQEVDDKYLERRRKNNLAAKKSRDARKIRENQLKCKVACLENANQVLRNQLERERKQNEDLNVIVKGVQNENAILKTKVAKECHCQSSSI